MRIIIYYYCVLREYTDRCTETVLDEPQVGMGGEGENVLHNYYVYTRPVVPHREVIVRVIVHFIHLQFT